MRPVDDNRLTTRILGLLGSPGRQAARQRYVFSTFAIDQVSHLIDRKGF